MHNCNEKPKSHFYVVNSNHNSHNCLTTFESAHKNIKSGNIESSTKEMDIKDFIKQKNKFHIQGLFDEREAKIFLDSKEKALMEIKLEDDIPTKNDEYEIKNKNIYKTDIKNESEFAENYTHKNKKSKKKIHKEKIASSNGKKGNSIKRKKSTYVKNKKTSTKNCSDNDKKYYNLETLNKNNDDSDDSNYIYKFIINNANESDEKFIEKLKNEMKKVEEKNEYNKNKNINKIYKSNTVKKTSKIKNKNNLFNFSETAKNLMVNADIEVSSINDDTTTINNNQIKIYDTVCKKGNNNKNDLFVDKNKNESNIIDNIVISSDKKSLLSLISDLIVK